MTATLLPEGKQRFTNSTGAPLVGGKLYTYDAGTSNPRVTYQDAAGTVPNANPVVFDARGEATVFWSGSYKVILKDAADVTIWSVDNIVSADSYSNAISTVLAASGGSALVGFIQDSVGAVATTLQRKGRERKSLLDFMSEALKLVVASGVYTALDRADMLAACNAAWASALATPHDLYVPAGRYELSEFSFPWRNTQFPVVSFLDCKNVTLYCDGPATVFATASAGGADVFQLNGMMNFHVAGFPTLTSTLTATSGAGSNGCSVTNGFDNLTLEISPTNCAGIDKGIYIDGGKGLTIQTPTAGQTLACGRLKATVNAKGCVHGFGLEQDIVTAIYSRAAIDIDLMAEDCYIAATYSAGQAAGGTVPAGSTVGLRVKGQAINCQHGAVIGRAHGINVDLQVVNSKTAAARRLNPSGVAWIAADTIVDSLLCTYAQNSKISVYGYSGACDYKARIGGAAAGTSGLYGGCYNTDFYLDLGGQPTIANLLNMDSGGNYIDSCRMFISSTTAVSAPVEWYTPARNNEITCGPAASVNFGNVKFPAVQFASTDPNTLDDYEEGAWVPTFGVSGGLTGAVFTILEAKFTKVGRLVNAMFAVVRNDASALAGVVTWSLPFPSDGTNTWFPCGVFYSTGTASSGLVVVDNYVNNGANGLIAATNVDLSYATIANGVRLNVSMTYMAG